MDFRMLWVRLRSHVVSRSRPHVPVESHLQRISSVQMPMKTGLAEILDKITSIIDWLNTLQQMGPRKHQTNYWAWSSNYLRGTGSLRVFTNGSACVKHSEPAHLTCIWRLCWSSWWTLLVQTKKQEQHQTSHCSPVLRNPRVPSCIAG